MLVVDTIASSIRLCVEEYALNKKKTYVCMHTHIHRSIHMHLLTCAGTFNGYKRNDYFLYSHMAVQLPVMLQWIHALTSSQVTCLGNSFEEQVD